VDSTDHKQNLHITAGKMVYERASRMLKLEQDPKIEFLKKDSVEVTGSLSGALIERNFETKQTIARGNVRLVQSDVTAVGQKAVFQEDTGAVVIEGEPGIEQEKGIIRCEKIVYYPEKKRLLLMNRIRGSLAKD
jgi:lipopolysaccharide export system protein LptA